MLVVGVWQDGMCVVWLGGMCVFSEGVASGRVGGRVGVRMMGGVGLVWVLPMWTSRAGTSDGELDLVDILWMTW